MYCCQTEVILSGLSWIFGAKETDLCGKKAIGVDCGEHSWIVAPRNSHLKPQVLRNSLGIYNWTSVICLITLLGRTNNYNVEGIIAKAFYKGLCKIDTVGDREAIGNLFWYTDSRTIEPKTICS